MGLGPLVGGALTDSVGWRAIFWINVPIGIAAIVLTFLFVPESRSSRPKRFDPVGQALVIVLLATLVGGLIEGPRLGWTSPGALGLFVVAAAALVLLVLIERRRHDPLIDVRFFRSIPFSTSVLAAIGAFGANGAFLFLNALYLQEVRGMSPFEAGLWTLPAAVATMLVSPLSGRLVGSIGTRVPLVLAGIGIGAGGLVLTTIGATTPLWILAVAFALFGFGFGMVNAPITNTAVSGMPRSQSGSAAAVASTSRQTGVSLGVALAGTVTGASAVASVGADFAVATHAMWWIVVGIAAGIIAIGFVSTSAAARRSVDGIADLLEEPAGAS
jgi:MFS family permease